MKLNKTIISAFAVIFVAGAQAATPGAADLDSCKKSAAFHTPKAFKTQEDVYKQIIDGKKAIGDARASKKANAEQTKAMDTLAAGLDAATKMNESLKKQMTTITTDLKAVDKVPVSKEKGFTDAAAKCNSVIDPLKNGTLFGALTKHRQNVEKLQADARALHKKVFGLK